ncbi:MAG: hypothetical protein GXP25_06020 [Planctomycetes bacterium]|nr:hypothetical protein [Planctomycetota bacterium]
MSPVDTFANVKENGIAARQQTAVWFSALVLGLTAVMVVLAIGLICVFLLRAQDAYRHAAAYSRMTGEADKALRQMASELAEAGNIRISPDGMTMTFQLPIRLSMWQLGEYTLHGSAPPPPTEEGWKPFDVNRDGRIDANDIHTRDGNGHVFWGARETTGNVWGNFMCYQFQYLDSNANDRADMDDCINESRIKMDINGDGRMDGVFLPGELMRFSSTEGDPTRAPEQSMTSVDATLMGSPTWAIVKWDKDRNRIARPDRQDVNGDGKADGPIFREMVWWRSRPVNHPLRKAPANTPGLWDVWPGYPRPEYRHGSMVRIDLWLLRITIDRRHFLVHIAKDMRLPKG